MKEIFRGHYSHRHGMALIRESWKKSKMRDHHRAYFAEKSRAQHWINLYMFHDLDFWRFASLSAHILFISQVSTVTSPVMILDFFPEITLGNGPKNSRIKVSYPIFKSDFWKYRIFDLASIVKMLSVSQNLPT